MKVRIISAVVATAILLGILAGSMFAPVTLFIAVGIVSAIAAYELARTTGFSKAPAVYILGGIMSCAAQILLYFSDLSGLIEVVFVAYVVLMFIYKLVKYQETDMKDMMTCMGMTLYVAYAFGSLLKIWKNYEYGSLAMFLLILALAMAWFSDSGAYFVGVTLGKHKLCPLISPKKTVEGFIGGIVSAIVLTGVFAAVYCNFIDKSTSVSWVGVLCIAGICSVLSVVGDLLFSSLKRQYGVKDYGTIMPGHGGVLDRFDSVLVVVPVFALFLEYLSIINT